MNKKDLKLIEDWYKQVVLIEYKKGIKKPIKFEELLNNLNKQEVKKMSEEETKQEEKKEKEEEQKEKEE